METRIHARVIIKILLDFWFADRAFFTKQDLDELWYQLIQQTGGKK